MQVLTWKENDMRISELITQLQETFQVHGDIHVLTSEYDIVTVIYELKAVRFDTDSGRYSTFDNANLAQYPEIGVIIE